MEISKKNMNERISLFVLRVEGLDSSSIHHLSKPITNVGRSNVRMLDIEINEIVAAPCHCRICWMEEHNRHVLNVLGTNGVYLNDEFIKAGDEPRTLKEGDEIRIGATTLVYARTA